MNLLTRRAFKRLVQLLSANVVQVTMTRVVLIAGFCWPWQLIASATPEVSPGLSQRTDGTLGVVQLNQGIVKRLGIETQAVAVREHTQEIQGLAEVIDIQPLLALRAQFRTAQAEEAIATATLSASTHEHERARALFRAGAATSQRQLHEAEARHDIDRARFIAMTHNSNALRERTLQQWGRDLTALALAAESPAFSPLADRRQVLLLASFERVPPGSAPGKEFYVGRSSERDNASRAASVWPAPLTSNVSQGLSYFVCVDAADMRTGMRLPVWAKLSSKSLRGVIVSESAIIWDAGLPWLYVESAPGRYQRTPVQAHVVIPEGWLVTAGLDHASRVVVRGGQLLLSEEMRQRIPQDD